MTIQEDKHKKEAFDRFISLLKGIESFALKHPTLTYIEFDYYVVHHMTLFSIEPDFDYERLKGIIQTIRKAMPQTKRIFSKPIIILRDSDDVLPVENARVLNQNTLLHLANHSQLVSNITDNKVRPRKLLTRIYEDDYSIYENIIFCNYIDEILYIVNSNRRFLNSLIYANDIMEFNLLEKANHLKYFLALGKLHTGYIRDFSQYLNLSRELLTDLASISRVIQPRLSKPIYQKNKRRNRELKLKKTNIFIAQKDYRHIFKTYKYLLNNPMETKVVETNTDLLWIRKNYMLFIQILSVFAAGHFNFDIDSKGKMNLTKLDVTLTFKDWKINIQNNNDQSVLLYFKKDTSYRLMIVDSNYDEVELRKDKMRRRLHDVIMVDPFDEDYQKRDHLYLSISDIDSFRRLQQVILKGMIYSDTERKICPFCGGHLSKHPEKGYYHCSDCMIQIKQGVCEENKQAFFYTDTPHRKKQVFQFNIDNDPWYADKQVESLMFFRNITKIDSNAQIICPHCHKVHKT